MPRGQMGGCVRADRAEIQSKDCHYSGDGARGSSNIGSLDCQTVTHPPPGVLRSVRSGGHLAPAGEDPAPAVAETGFTSLHGELDSLVQSSQYCKGRTTGTLKEG